MSAYLSEQEQIQVIKDWWKTYGMSVVLGIVIALAGSYGWRYWQQYNENYMGQASVVYEQMLIAKTNQQTNDFNNSVQQLTQKYGRSPYAALANLAAANQAITQNQLDQSIKPLTWVSQHAKDHNLQQIADIRLARVLLAQQKPQQALPYLNKVNDAAFAPLVASIRGDAYAALGNNANARDAYQQALSGLPKNTGLYTLVEMKLTALGNVNRP